MALKYDGGSVSVELQSWSKMIFIQLNMDGSGPLIQFYLPPTTAMALAKTIELEVKKLGIECALLEAPKDSH